MTAYREIFGAGDDVVVVSEASQSGEYAIAFDAADGTELWRLPVYPQLDTAPGSVNDTVVVIESAVETPPFVTGVDPRTGAELWRLPPGTSVIAATDEVVVTANASRYQQRMGGGIFGIDRATGAELWSNPETFEGDSGSGGAAAITDGVVAVPSGNSVTGIDLATGETLWSGGGAHYPGGQRRRRRRRQANERSADRHWRDLSRRRYDGVDRVRIGVVWRDPRHRRRRDRCARPGRPRGIRVGERDRTVAPRSVGDDESGRAATDRRHVARPALGSGAGGALDERRGDAVEQHAAAQLAVDEQRGVNQSTVYVAVNSLPFSD